MSIAEKFNIPPALFETIRKMNAEETEYQMKVKALMKKKGITSLSQLSPEEKKDFFNTLDAMHKAKHEGVELDEAVTDYNPKSQGGTRKELLAKFAETGNSKHAEAARKAGATQDELKKAKAANVLKQSKKEEIELDEGKVKELMMDINDVASKMKKNKTLEPFAGKFVTAAKKSLNIKKSLEDVLPDYISGAEIAKLYKEEIELEEGKSGTGYELYHKDFSSAMSHAYDFAKKKYGIEVDPQEIDRNVAMGPKKPSSGKANAYRLLDKTGKKAIQVQVANLDNKRYELNMYKEDVQIDEVAASKALQKAHDAERKKRGLPDPSYYLKLAAQKKKEIEDMKKETQKEESGASKKKEDKFDTKLDKLDTKTLQTLAGAKIKFVSGLAQNRIVRKMNEVRNPQTSMKRASLSMDRAKEVVRHQKEIGSIRKKREALRNSFDPESNIEEKVLWPGTPEYKKKHGTDKEKHELKYGKSDVKKLKPYGYRDNDSDKTKIVREAIDKMKKKKNEATAKESKKDFKSGDKLSGKTEPIEINPELKEQKT
jgi:hypothetical protein